MMPSTRPRSKSSPGQAASPPSSRPARRPSATRHNDQCARPTMHRRGSTFHAPERRASIRHSPESARDRSPPSRICGAPASPASSLPCARSPASRGPTTASRRARRPRSQPRSPREHRLEPPLALRRRRRPDVAPRPDPSVIVQMSQGTGDASDNWLAGGLDLPAEPARPAPGRRARSRRRLTRDGPPRARPAACGAAGPPPRPGARLRRGPRRRGVGRERRDRGDDVHEGPAPGRESHRAA